MDADDFKGYCLEEVEQTHSKRRCLCRNLFFAYLFFTFFRLSAVKPENVNLTANVTTNETCLSWIVKFTCVADANPAVDKYFLYEDDTIVDMDVSGVWNRPLNKSGHVMYRCKANNSRGNKTSSSISFTVGGKVQYRVRIENDWRGLSQRLLVRLLIDLQQIFF